MPLLVHDETPVSVTVEGQPDISTSFDHMGLQIDEVCRVQRIGLVVGEGAIELEVER